ncbi:hypothetical protein JXC34_03165 [Candidatus Woesearchaeota archaeon]|nr:hypothetical protein [Candidatus Woesearchaeota archaeon]
MKLKLKKENPDGVVRVESSGDVKEILINEDMLHPNEESISVCYRGKNSSGIVDFTPEEIEEIYDAIKSRIHLIKGFKRLSGSGAKLF